MTAAFFAKKIVAPALAVSLFAIPSRVVSSRFSMKHAKPLVRPGEVPPKHPYAFPDELPRLAPRKPEGTKADYGKCLVIGGSRGTAGSAMLAASAALRAGAGTVVTAAPESSITAIAAHQPALGTLALPEDDCGKILLRPPFP
jgi:hypothetical protein